jgi:hypothetical protein
VWDAGEMALLGLLRMRFVGCRATDTDNSKDATILQKHGHSSFGGGRGGYSGHLATLNHSVAKRRFLAFDQ